MPLRVIFTRHGESTANVDGIFANRVDLPGDLTPLGRAQARDLARRLASIGPDHVYTSPLPRAVQTARIVAKSLELPLTLTDALREYDVGDFEGLPYTGADAWRMDAYWDVDQAWASGNLDARLPGGESLRAILERFLPFMTDLPKRHGETDIVVAIGHGGLFRAVLPHLFTDAPASITAREALRHGDMIVANFDGTGWRFERRVAAGTSYFP